MSMKFNNFLNNYFVPLEEGINDVGIFKAVFMSGMPGAGKSYTMKKIKSGSVEPRIVNTDKFQEELYGKYTQEFIDKSKRLTISQLVLYLNSMLPLFVDSTSAWQSNLVKRNSLLEGVGYDTAMVFVNVPIEVAKERASKRERPVDPEYIDKAYQSLKQAKEFFKSKFPLFLEVNNTEEGLNNKAILNIYKKISFFFTSPIKNPVGKESVSIMRENGWKYLIDGIMDIKQIKLMSKLWFHS